VLMFSVTVVISTESFGLTVSKANSQIGNRSCCRRSMFQRARKFVTSKRAFLGRKRSRLEHIETMLSSVQADHLFLAYN
jgi:hypothetical protein